ncbi:MAG: hypothetical protein ABL927_00890, partial [Bdellovibrionales bacterium]
KLQCLILLAIFGICTVAFSNPIKNENHSQLSNNLSHSDSIFRCPELQLNSLMSQTSELKSGTLTQLTYLLDRNELSPFITGPTGLHQQYLTYVEPFLTKFFSPTDLNTRALPNKLRLIQTAQINPLSALYCTEFQTPDTLTILISPDMVGETEELLKIIVHEFVHDYFYKNYASSKLNLPLWYEEGTALLSEYVFSNKPSGSAIVEHLSKPTASFLKDISNPALSLSAYGEAQLFFMYLHNFLEDDFLTALLKAPSAERGQPIQRLDQIISSSVNSPWKSFADAYRDFQIAKHINRMDPFATSGFEQKRYFIFQSTLHANANAVASKVKDALANAALKKSSALCYQVNNSEFEQIRVIQLDDRAILQNPKDLQNTNEHFIICP